MTGPRVIDGEPLDGAVVMWLDPNGDPCGTFVRLDKYGEDWEGDVRWFWTHPDSDGGPYSWDGLCDHMAGFTGPIIIGDLREIQKAASDV